MEPERLKIFDSHFHVIDGRFPLIPDHGYVPQRFDCGDYLARMKGYRLVGGAVVSGSFQGFDQTYLLAALNKLGPSFVGVTQIPMSISDAEIQALDRAGVRAVRFNLRRGGSENVRFLERFAWRIHELAGWHVELYADASQLVPLRDLLVRLPAVSIDHLGLSRAGLLTLRKLVEKGVKVKATGFGRVDFDVKTAIRDLFSANPNALMFGTDLPSTRVARPYEDGDLLRIVEAVGAGHADQILFSNAARFYASRRLEKL